MEIPNDIQELIKEINFRSSNSKDYEKMKIEEISMELRDIMKFEQDSFKKIEEFEKIQDNSDFVKYAKMICKNTVEREVVEIQEIYLKKIDKEYLNTK